MRTAISKAASGVGSAIGNAFTAPFKSIFGGSCEGVCSGTWDIICFIEHLCVSNLVKLLMVSGLCYITILFFYLLAKVGIIQCIGRNLCKMCWIACETYWFAVNDVTCFLWHKLINVKRVNRRRRRQHFQDIESGYSRSDGSDASANFLSRKRKSIRTKGRLQTSLSKYGNGNHHYHHSHHHGSLKTKALSVHVRGGSRRCRSSRQVQIRRVQKHRGAAMFKRRRLR